MKLPSYWWAINIVMPARTSVYGHGHMQYVMAFTVVFLVEAIRNMVPNSLSKWGASVHFFERGAAEIKQARRYHRDYVLVQVPGAGAADR